jgi:hypothetical protein
MARIAAQLDEQGHLRDGVSAEEANDVLWVLTSFESFDLLYSGRGLPLDAVVERLTEDRGAVAYEPLNMSASWDATSLFSGTNWFALNVAPPGSRITVPRIHGASNGGTTTVPPSSSARLAVASASVIPKVTSQCGLRVGLAGRRSR